MKFTNLPEFNTALEAAVMRGIEKDIVSVFKGVVMQAAQALIAGDFRYAGTPEWSGNAAANWWPSVDGGPQPFEEFFHDVPRPGQRDFPRDFVSPYSAATPRPEAIEMSELRIKAFLQELPGIPKQVVIQNTAPYLLEYQPYGPSQKTFRLENLYPLSATRAVLFMNQQVASASRQQLDAWKVGFVK
jgi:hypothetical protein